MRFYYTEVAVNAEGGNIKQAFFVLPKNKLKSISFTVNTLSDTIQNDTKEIYEPCIFIASVTSYDELLNNGMAFGVAGRDLSNHRVMTVIYKNGTYSFSDFSSCYDYIVFGVGSWTNNYARFFMPNFNIEVN